MSTSYNVFVNSSKATLRLDVREIKIEPERSPQVTLTSQQIDHLDWFILGRFATLQIYTTSKRFYSISELKSSNQKSIEDYFINNLELSESQMKTHTVQIKGHNDGELELREKSFALESEGKVILNLPYSKINQAQATSINDLMMEFNPDDEGEGESLFSVRFLVPNEAQNTAKDLRLNIDQRTDLTAGTSHQYAELKDVNFVKPKKKYNLRFCDDLIFLHNKDVNYKIYYPQISMIHRLERPDPDPTKKSEYIFFSLSRPIRQGQKAYPNLVISTSDVDQVNGEGIEEKKTLADTIQDFMLRCGNINFEPTSGFFENMAGETGCSCQYKGSNGFLYMSRKAFIFLHSTVLYIPYDKVKSVRFENPEDTMNKKKNFDLTVNERNSGNYTFIGIDTFANVQVQENDEKEEEFEHKAQLTKQFSVNGFSSFVEFLKTMKIKIEDSSSIKSLMSILQRSVSDLNSRRSKSKARQAIREDASGSGGSDEEEEDQDFDPNAKQGSSSSSSSSSSDSDAEEVKKPSNKPAKENKKEDKKESKKESKKDDDSDSD